MKRDQGRIFSFYSYKGGTGRTMALANVGWILASNGCRVLMIDWDLEAPGLHRYVAPFLDDPRLENTEGVIDYLSSYVIAVTKEPEQPSESGDSWILEYSDIARYAVPIQWRFPDGGCIDLVGAGRQNSSYGMLVNGFDWEAFYGKFGGGSFLDHAVHQMKESYDYILIDSRTGISDTSGICTVHLPDDIVVLYTLNNQSVEGASGVAEVVARQRANDASDTPFGIFPVTTRVELTEKEKLADRRNLARERFSPFLDTLTALDSSERQRYPGRMEVLYDPYYAYDEILATIADKPDQDISVLSAMEKLTGYITRGRVTKLGRMSESKRKEALAAYNWREPESREEAAYRARGEADWDVFISAEGPDQKAAKLLFDHLNASYKPYYPLESLTPGESLSKSVETAVQSAKVHVVFVPSCRDGGAVEALMQELSIANERRKTDESYRIIPVQMHDAADTPEELVRLLGDSRWLDARERDMYDVARMIGEMLTPRSKVDEEADQVERLKVLLEQAHQQRSDAQRRLEELDAERDALSRSNSSFEERTNLQEKRIEELVREREQAASRVAELEEALSSDARATAVYEERTKSQRDQVEQLTMRMEEAIASQRVMSEKAMEASLQARGLARQRLVLMLTFIVCLVGGGLGAYRWGVSVGTPDDKSEYLASIAGDFGETNPLAELLCAYASVTVERSADSIAALRAALGRREEAEGRKRIASMSADQLIHAARTRLAGGDRQGR